MTSHLTACFLVIKGNQDKYDDHRDFLTNEYCYIDLRKKHIDHIKYTPPFSKEILIANGILPSY